MNIEDLKKQAEETDVLKTPPEVSRATLRADAAEQEMREAKAVQETLLYRNNVKTFVELVAQINVLGEQMQKIIADTNARREGYLKDMAECHEVYGKLEASVLREIELTKKNTELIKINSDLKSELAQKSRA